jgi:hypothetical protein
MSEEQSEEDCPVSNALCEARMAAFREEVDGIKNTIKATGAAIAIILTIVEIILRLI